MWNYTMEGGEHRTSELNAQRKKGADETLTSSALERMSIGVEEEHIEQREQVPYQPMRMHGGRPARCPVRRVRRVGRRGKSGGQSFTTG
ncbi:unnamed protein product [[Candida] boidinii]|nr:unnamed protein product [[Candida] boidinii]GMG18557.1 unnamed protein product [[Candida] boidinii]